MDKQLAQRTATPEGPEDKPWEQMIEPGEMSDTSEFKKEGGGNVCFSNASVDNPWRQVGWKTMQAEVKLHDNIKKFRALDAEAKDEKQISDVEELAGGKCDVLIVSPNTTKTLTPAVEAACEKIPVVVFDRGVTTDCPVTFVHPIGGYAFGATAAEFLKEKVKPGGKVLALRILPGVDVLETRWSGRRRSSTSPSSRWSAWSSRTATRPRRSRSSATTSSARASSTASGWTPAPPPCRPSRPSRTRARTCRRSTARTSRTSSRSGRRTG
jgi:ribose transport system substrate-binding protein